MNASPLPSLRFSAELQGTPRMVPTDRLRVEAHYCAALNAVFGGPEEVCRAYLSAVAPCEAQRAGPCAARCHEKWADGESLARAVVVKSHGVAEQGRFAIRLN